jgi:hypothetical protein
MDYIPYAPTQQPLAVNEINTQLSQTNGNEPIFRSSQINNNDNQKKNSRGDEKAIVDRADQQHEKLDETIHGGDEGHHLNHAESPHSTDTASSFSTIARSSPPSLPDVPSRQQQERQELFEDSTENDSDDEDCCSDSQYSTDSDGSLSTIAPIPLQEPTGKVRSDVATEHIKEQQFDPLTKPLRSERRTAQSDDEQTTKFVKAARRVKNKNIWHSMLDGFVAYKAKHGVPPKKGVIHNGRDLGAWVISQRSLYRNRRDGKPGALSVDRIQELKNVGFDFSPSKYRKRHDSITNSLDASSVSTASLPRPKDIVQDDDNTSWNRMLKGLSEFFHENNHFRVPHKYKYAGQNLHSWLATQVRHYHNHIAGRADALGQDRIQQMEAIGYDFSFKHGQGSAGRKKRGGRRDEEGWDNMLAGLAGFYSKHKHFRLPVGFMHDGKNLHAWLAGQKVFYTNTTFGKKGRHLSQDRIDKMKAIGFCFKETQYDGKNSERNHGPQQVNRRRHKPAEIHPGRCQKVSLNDSNASALPMSTAEARG